MSNINFTNVFKKNIWTKVADIDGDTFNAVLLVGTSALSDSTIKGWTTYANVSAYEVVGTGYTAGGIELSGVYETSATGDAATRQWIAQSLAWPNSSFTADAVTIIDKTLSDQVAIYFPLGENKTAVAGTFYLSWPSNVISDLI